MRLLTCHVIQRCLVYRQVGVQVDLRGRVPGAWVKGQAVHGEEPLTQPLRTRLSPELVRNKRGRSENAMRAIEDAILKPGLS